MANQTRRPDQPRTGLFASPRLVFGLPFGAGVVLHVMTGGNVETGGNAAAVALGAVLVAAGLFLSGWATIALRREGEHPDPAVPSGSLVSGGPYRFSRNPIYVAFMAIAAGIGLVLNSLWVLGSVPPAAVALQLLVISREERYLESVFGAQYADYRERVRRWL